MYETSTAVAAATAAVFDNKPKTSNAASGSKRGNSIHKRGGQMSQIKKNNENDGIRKSSASPVMRETEENINKLN